MKIPNAILIPCAAFLVASCDRIMFSEQTRFAPGFSERAFNNVKKGMPMGGVTNLLGSPLAQATQQWSDAWLYEPKSAPPTKSGKYVYDLFGPFTRFYFNEIGNVREVSGNYLRGDFLGAPKEAILKRFGEPTVRENKELQLIYRYSLPGKSGTYKRRDICFDTNGVVSSTITELYQD